MTEELVVGVGSYHVSKEPVRLVCISLGSCVAISIHDARRDIGGLSHAMLPFYGDGRDKVNAAKYVDTSIYLMVDDILENGMRKRELKAKISGGAQMFSYINSDSLDIGSRNIDAAREVLKKEGIRLVAEDVGGHRGRTVHFDVVSGGMSIQASGEIVRVI